ncbi:MAG: transcriptional regulator [Paenibacillaceae bacterium]|jgi:predicted DNA-binding transcriptional regulator YafY|nr:transcriptional regulator [Paenibacillaceae bacterium]
MQLNRLFQIVYILLDKKLTTAKELADRFEVSVRTIYRDIDILSSAGVPIYTSQGKGGGISLMDHFVLNKSILSEAEQSEILFALQSLSAVQNPETDKVLSKLSSLFQKTAGQWIEVDFSPWGSKKQKTEEFILLKDAILSNQIIEFQYCNASGETSSRRVEPVKLIYKVNAWYLQGICLDKQEYRTFKISRTSDLRATQDHFVVRAMENQGEENEKASSQQWIKVELKISPQGAYRVYDEFHERDIVKQEDGSFTIAASLPEGEWLLHHLLSFGADLEVLAPQSLRCGMEEKLAKMMGHYKEKGG